MRALFNPHPFPRRSPPLKDPICKPRSSAASLSAVLDIRQKLLCLGLSDSHSSLVHTMATEAVFSSLQHWDRVLSGRGDEGLMAACVGGMKGSGWI